MDTPRTTADFLAKLRKPRLFWPANEAARPLANADLLSLASDVFADHIWPALRRADVDYLTTELDYPIKDPTVFASGALYSLPSESYLQTDAIWYIDTQGNRYLLDRYHETDLSPTREVAQGRPRAYYYRGGRIGLVPAPQDGFLRIRFSARPLRMVEYDPATANTFRIVQQYSGDNITVDSALPTTWIAAEDYLVLSAAPPHVPVAWIEAANVLSHAGSVLEVDSAAQWPASSLASHAPVNVGDIVVEGYDCPVLQLPPGALSWALSEVETLVATARGDRSKMALLEARAARERQTFLDGLRPRDGEGQVYIPDDRGYPTEYWRTHLGVY